LTDATINLDYEPGDDGNRYPPSVRLSEEDSAAVLARFKELGLGD
jgi:hypothetical protein